MSAVEGKVFAAALDGGGAAAKEKNCGGSFERSKNQ
jgi:hypothetical protein